MCPVDVRCRRLIWGSLGTNLSERLRSGVDPVCSSSVIWRFACTTRMRHFRFELAASGKIKRLDIGQAE